MAGSDGEDGDESGSEEKDGADPRPWWHWLNNLGAWCTIDGAPAHGTRC